MPDTLTDTELSQALATCAEEPIHIPGSVQPFGALIAADPETGRIAYASENTETVFGRAADQLLGRNARDVLGQELWHGVKNAISRADAATQATLIGSYSINNRACVASACFSDGVALFELEEKQESIFAGTDGLNALRLFAEEIQGCADLENLYEVTVRLLRHITGYNRVMIYKFDRDWNGEVLAEDRRRDMESFIGLRFPHWDIPAQAREMMVKLPLRFIQDVDQSPVPLRALDQSARPLDMSLMATRGVSAVHMEYLRNVGVTATMTLTIKVEGVLWGIISFHHERPRVPAPELREVLVNIAQIFTSKLQILQQNARLALVGRVDALKDDVLDAAQEAGDLDIFLGSVMDLLTADGVVLIQNQQERQRGSVPDDILIETLKQDAAHSQDPLAIERLSEAYPSLDNALGGLAGALVYAPDDDRCLLVFRKETAQYVHWAGNPEKTPETVEDRLRLSPRGSFARYLQQVSGRAVAWSEQDLYFASRIWAVINSIERSELVASLNRQQKILIHELNHRVRNILALVRSVSQQARTSSYGSLESYARSLEARIEALAASHELASSSLTAVVQAEELIAREFQPFTTGVADRFTITGNGPALRADVAPIFSLVVHELVTNAVKYGALSNTTGRVAITLTQKDGGVAMAWRETGGPKVVAPAELGFGSTLIKQAVPYELDGEATLNFEPSGVTAELFLPKKLFEPAKEALPADEALALGQSYDEDEFARAAAGAVALIVEDHFMIARTAQSDLAALGVTECEIMGRAEDALDYLGAVTPSFAILDVNLGNGETSFPVAQRLMEMGVPFFFVTGYGDSSAMPMAFKATLKLTKPVPKDALKSALATVLLG